MCECVCGCVQVGVFVCIYIGVCEREKERENGANDEQKKHLQTHLLKFSLFFYFHFQSEQNFSNEFEIKSEADSVDLLN